MSTDTNEVPNLQNELKKKRICRFCLTQSKLSNIFTREDQQTLAPLSVQVMACASIEVFTNDGMPPWICSDCRLLFEHSYRFKQMCKKADTLLRQFPLTGEWPRPLDKPKIPSLESPKQIHNNTVQASKPVNNNTSTMQQKIYNTSPSTSKKILNSNPAPAPEPPVPVRSVVKREQEHNIDDLEFPCNEFLMDEVHRLIGTVGAEEEYPPAVKRPPKVLNKGSIRILNKEANVIVEPKMSIPKVKLDEDGNIIVTACIDPLVQDEKQQIRSIKPAEPILTDVYPCPQCDRSFPLLQLRDIHMVNHNRERRFQCPDCDKSFFSKYDLQKHEVRHTGEKPFRCVVCDKGFSRATLLHRHERVHTEIPKYLCVYCEKAFLSKDEMETHTQRHEKNRPYKCRVCSKTFAFKQGLERHETVHSSIQPYPCQYCEQSFSTPSKLARHLTAHAGKRPYPCKYCPKSYVLSHHLTRHMRSHKQNKVAHTCSECEKDFKSRDELIYHTAVHSTVSLVCTLCQAKFSSAEEVTVHIKKHIESDAFACEYCDLIFISSGDLIAHCEASHLKEMSIYNPEEKPIVKNDEISTTTTTNNNITSETCAADASLTEIDVVRTDEEKHEEHLEEEEEDGENNHEGGENMEYEEKASEKPKILNQILIRSKQDVKYFMVRQDANEMNESMNRGGVEEQAAVQQEVAKKRRIISVEGCLKEIDVTTVDTAMPAQKRGKFVPPEKSHEIKVEEGINLPKTNNNGMQQTNSISSRNRSNESNKPVVMQVKSEEPPKRPIRRVPPTSTASSTSSISSNVVKTEIGGPKIKQIRVTKSQAEALTKQGRIQIKDGNMVLTKETSSAPRITRMSKK